MTARQLILKTLLWGIIGVLAAVTVSRFTHGLGATTNLTSASPWGFWIAFDVMAGVALAAGGFMVAATVHIFHIEKYHSFARPAILTALLGYTAVATGLLYDLGLPWNIWHPMLHPQVHSVLFEVAMCVMLYLTVLFLEFCPVILEHPMFNRPLYKKIHSILKKISVPLVILGVMLSTLHQSSLGSLFLIAPHRLHPLWYSPLIWVLFFISAAGLGLMMVVLESYFSAWFFRHKLKINLISGLAKAGAIVLLLYAGLRLFDLATRGVLSRAFDGSFEGNLFLFELFVSAIIPGVLLLIPKVRNNTIALGSLAFLCILGVIGYRFDVCIVSFSRPEGMTYFPTWMEVVVSVGIVAGAMLVFIFLVEKLRVYTDDDHEVDEPEGKPVSPSKLASPSPYSPARALSMLPESLAGPRRYSLAVLVGAAIAIALLPKDALLGSQPVRSPVHESRTLDGYLVERTDAFGHDMIVPADGDTAPVGGVATSLLVLDGNRNSDMVLFAHENHVLKLGEDDSCVLCHHQEVPFQKQTQCYVCHQDMHLDTDIFDHSSHIAKLDGNDGCTSCHQDPDLVKSRDTTRDCGECHDDMMVAGARVPLPEEGMTGLAVGYMDAMHNLCIKCHEERVVMEPERIPASFAECATCHRKADRETLLLLPPHANARQTGERKP